MPEAAGSPPQSDKNIFNCVNLKVLKGEKISIIGKTGSGKSTLIKIILGLYELNNDSEVIVLGNNIKYSKYEIWNKVGYVDNDNYLFSGSLEYNITLKNHLTSDDFKSLKEILSMLKIEYLLEKNLDIRQFGSNLSGGEKLKISVARALFKKPQLLILDEPTASMDEYSEKIFCEIIRNIKITTLIVTHRRQVMDICDKIYEISEQKVSEIKYIGR